MQELHVLIMPDLSFHWHVNPGPSSGALSPEFDGTVAFDKANRGNPISTDTAVDVGATEHHSSISTSSICSWAERKRLR
jgi:hypothetical protein